MPKSKTKPRSIEQQLMLGLHQVASVFSAVTGLTLSSIARAGCNNARFFENLAAGKSCTVRIYSDMMQYFSDHWPVGTQWPEGVRRPSPTSPEPQKAPKPYKKRKD